MEEAEVIITSVRFIRADSEGWTTYMEGKQELDFAHNPFSLITLEIEFQTFGTRTGEMFIRVHRENEVIKNSEPLELKLTPGLNHKPAYIHDINFPSPGVYEFKFLFDGTPVEQQLENPPIRLTLT